MKVILLKDVAKIGRRFSIIDVPDGYALNKLIPKGMAQFATAENIKRIQSVSTKQKEHQAHDAEAFRQMLAVLKDVQVPIEVEANPEGRMFQALKAETIAQAITQATGVPLDTEHIELKTPIKSIGEHQVTLRAGLTEGIAVIILNAKVK